MPVSCVTQQSLGSYVCLLLCHIAIIRELYVPVTVSQQSLGSYVYLLLCHIAITRELCVPVTVSHSSH